jgi:MYXO-CTERM domain-containing protein
LLSTSAEAGQTPAVGGATSGTQAGPGGGEEGIVVGFALAGALGAGAGRRRRSAGRDDGAEAAAGAGVILAQPASRTVPPRVSRARREGRGGVAGISGMVAGGPFLGSVAPHADPTDPDARRAERLQCVLAGLLFACHIGAYAMICLTYSVA